MSSNTQTQGFVKKAGFYLFDWLNSAAPVEGEGHNEAKNGKNDNEGQHLLEVFDTNYDRFTNETIEHLHETFPEKKNCVDSEVMIKAKTRWREQFIAATNAAMHEPIKQPKGVRQKKPYNRIHYRPLPPRDRKVASPAAVEGGQSSESQTPDKTSDEHQHQSTVDPQTQASVVRVERREKRREERLLKIDSSILEVINTTWLSQKRKKPTSIVDAIREVVTKDFPRGAHTPYEINDFIQTLAKRCAIVVSLQVGFTCQALEKANAGKEFAETLNAALLINNDVYTTRDMLKTVTSSAAVGAATAAVGAAVYHYFKGSSPSATGAYRTDDSSNSQSDSGHGYWGADSENQEHGGWGYDDGDHHQWSYRSGQGQSSGEPPPDTWRHAKYPENFSSATGRPSKAGTAAQGQHGEQVSEARLAQAAQAAYAANAAQLSDAHMAQAAHTAQATQWAASHAAYAAHAAHVSPGHFTHFYPPHGMQPYSPAYAAPPGAPPYGWPPPAAYGAPPHWQLPGAYGAPHPGAAPHGWPPPAAYGAPPHWGPSPAAYGAPPSAPPHATDAATQGAPPHATDAATQGAPTGGFRATMGNAVETLVNAATVGAPLLAAGAQIVRAVASTTRGAVEHDADQTSDYGS